jgi:hypothetical protein
MVKLTKKETYIINDIKKLAEKGLEESNNIAIPMGLVVNNKMIEDTGQPVLIRQKIPFTDFPEGILKMYCIDNILLLPSEY